MIRMRIHRFATQLVSIAVTFMASAYAQTWTSPVALSTGGQGWEASAAIDGNGNSVALWDERTNIDQLWSRSEPAGGNWGPTTSVSPALQTTYVFPVVRTNHSGFATAVWSDQGGVWTADRPPASGWNPAQLLVPGASNPIFLMDSQGDAAIAWTVGGGPRSTTGSVMAIVRPAGGAWTAQQVVASGPHLIVDHAGIGESGDVIVTWETYNAVCHRYGCSQTSYVLHASRQNAASGAWVDSGSLLGPDITAHKSLVAMDSAGGAILLALSSSGAYISATQANSGGAWSPFTTAVNPQGSVIISDLASDDAGQVTLVYESIGFSSSQVLAVNSSISNNTWSSPVVLSGQRHVRWPGDLRCCSQWCCADRLVVQQPYAGSPRCHESHRQWYLECPGQYLRTRQLHLAGSRRSRIFGKCDCYLFRVRRLKRSHGIRHKVSALRAARTRGRSSRVRKRNRRCVHLSRDWIR